MNAIFAGSELSYDEKKDILYMVDSDSNKIVCPDLGDTLPEAVECVSQRLPEITLEVDRGGNPRKSLEIESMYKMICLCHFIKGFSNRFSEYLTGYDFARMVKPVRKDAKTIYKYQQTIKDIGSARINNIFSGAAVKLSIYKETEVNRFKVFVKFFYLSTIKLLCHVI